MISRPVALLCIAAAVFAQDLRVRDSVVRSGIDAAGAAGVYLYKTYRTAHNGVTHEIYRQRFQGVDVHGVEFTINLDRDGNTLNSGGGFVDGPALGLTPPHEATALAASRAAVRAINPELAKRFLPAAIRTDPNRPGGVIFAAGPLASEVAAEVTWFPLRGELVPAWIFNAAGGDSAESFEVVVEAGGNQRILWRTATSFFQRPAAPKALVFTGESPQANPSPGVRLQGPPPLSNRKMVALEGDPTASPQGWLTGSGTSTVGNNVVAGQNSLGTRFTTEPRTVSVNAQGEFAFPFEFGAGTNPLDYHENAVTNLFYWVNRAHDFFYNIGFDEAAGNFQNVNYTQAGTGGDALLAYAHFAVAQPGGAATNNAFFSWRSTADGSQPMIAMYVTTGGALRIPGDTSLDAGVIVHEYTHGVSSRLVRNGYTTFQGASMGEAWSDFFALEMLTPEGAPVDGVYPLGEYFLQSWGSGLRTRPYSTNMDVNPLGYQHLGRVRSFPEVHADGEIWVQCLWEMRANLIRQFGEAEGRRRARLLVIDGMKLSIPAPTMVDARDAILLADRAGFRGESQQQIWQAFAKRGMGALAFTPDGASTEVIASFDTPSGPSVAYYGSGSLIGQSALIVGADPSIAGNSMPVTVKSSSGDAETVILARRGSLFTALVPTSTSGFDSAASFFGSAAVRGDGVLQIIPNDTMTVEYKSATAQSPVKAGYYAFAASAAGADLQFPNEVRLPVDSFGVSATLPFEFPFYGKTYSTIDIMPSGRLGFGVASAVDPCFDDLQFRKTPSIAPLFVDMSVSPVFDPAAGVFVSATADSVTFRWKGSLWNSTFSPVNFASTLFRNGTIRFDYGSGNTQLHTPTYIAGCGRGPVAGITPGNAYADMFPYPGTFEKAPSVTFAPPSAAAAAPDGYLDPVIRSGNAITIQGGAIGRESTIIRRDVLIDGVYTGTLSPLAPSAAVCARLGVPAPCSANNGQGLAGVVSLVPRLATLSEGSHGVQVRLTNAAGVSSTIPAQPVTFDYAPPQRQIPVGKIESPAEGLTVSGTITVRGYAYMPVNRISRVDLILDGGATIGGVAYGLPRTDICSTPPPGGAVTPNCPLAGFQASVSTVSAPIVITDGEHTLSLRVTDSLGNVISMPETAVKFKVDNGGAQPPTGVLVTPVSNQTASGEILIWGYGWSPFAGRRVTSAALVVDGAVIRNLTYGEERTNECASLANPPPACPAIGFSGLLDTRTMRNGLHSIGVRLLNERGESVIVPFSGRFGVDVFVQN